MSNNLGIRKIIESIIGALDVEYGSAQIIVTFGKEIDIRRDISYIICLLTIGTIWVDDETYARLDRLTKTDKWKDDADRIFVLSMEIPFFTQGCIRDFAVRLRDSIEKIKIVK